MTQLERLTAQGASEDDQDGNIHKYKNLVPPKVVSTVRREEDQSTYQPNELYCPGDLSRYLPYHDCSPNKNYCKKHLRKCILPAKLCTRIRSAVASLAIRNPARYEISVFT
jgi:hypothetical protein